MDLVTILLGGVAGMAGAIGASAEKGDRLSDIPKVFLRRPYRFLGAGVLTAICVVIGQSLRGA